MGGKVLNRKINLLFLVLFFIIIFSLFFAFGSENNESNGSSNETIIITSEVQNKIHEDLRKEILERNKVKVIIEVKEKNKLDDVIDKIEEGRSKARKSKDKKLIFAEIRTDEFNQIALDSDIEKIWLDRETNVFLDSSVEQINAPIFWNEGFNGSWIKIAILDTGIDKNHEMLSGKVILERDFTGENNPNDYYGHGTHVAGIAAGNGNYIGVAPGTLILNGKVLNNQGSGRLSWLIDGIEWALNPDNNPSTDDGADIISLSLGAIYNEDPERALFSPDVLKVEEAISKGVVVVIASGNCANGCRGFRGVTTPGISRNAITVGAVDDNNEWLEFSSGGVISDFIKPDLVAPGENICSSVPRNYACLTGTSMSTPHVSGAAALLLDKNPILNPLIIKNILEEGAIDHGSQGKDTKYGSGLIDMNNLDIPDNGFNNENYKLEIPVFEINREDEIKLIYFNKLNTEDELKKFSNVEDVSDLNSEEVAQIDSEIKDDNKILSDKKDKKIKVIFEIEELDNTVRIEKEKIVSSGKIEEFSFEWTPYFIGKHLLKVSIFEDEELVEYSEVGVSVTGDFIDRIANVEVLIR